MAGARAKLGGIAFAVGMLLWLPALGDEGTALRANQSASIELNTSGDVGGGAVPAGDEPRLQEAATSSASSGERTALHEASAAAVSATDAAKASAKTGATGEGAGEASAPGEMTVSEAGRWGTYNAPALVMNDQVAVGAARGTARGVDRSKVEAAAGGSIAEVLGGLALGAVVVTLMVAARTSRVKRADGQKVRALTVATRLVLAFGGVTVAILVLGMMGQRTQNHLAVSSREAERLSDMASTAKDLHRDAVDVHGEVLAVMTGNADEHLVRVNNALATMNARLEALDSQALTAAEAEQKRRVMQQAGELANAAELAVGTQNERVSTLASQVVPAANRISRILTSIERGTSGKRALEISRCNTMFQQAQAGLLRYLSDTNNEHAQTALELGTQCLEQINGVSAEGGSGAIKAVLEEAAGATRFWLDRVARVQELTRDRDEIVSGALAKGLGDIEREASALASGLQSRREGVDRAAAATSRTDLVINLALIFGAVALAAGVCAVIVRSLGRAMAPVLSTLAKVAKGDLTMRPINSVAADELGELSRSVDAMVAGVKDVLTEVATSTQDVSAAATEIAASAEEMSNSVGEVARQAQQAAAAADQAGSAAKTGGSVVGKTVESMNRIHSSVESTAKNITELGEKSEEIGRIIEVINDIAEQTNLLALNAAIEAARAGVHGRGFAVVADEVRKLAERTTKATEEVTQSIQAIQQQTVNAVSAMHQGTSLVSGGVSFAGEAKANLESIVGGASTVASMIRAITAAGEEAGAGASQSAAAAGQLSARAEELRVMVGRFRIT